MTLDIELRGNSGTTPQLRGGIFWKLLRWFLLLSLLPLLIYGFRATSQSRDAITLETENFLVIRARDIGQRVTDLLHECENDLRFLVTHPRTAQAYSRFVDSHRKHIWTREGTNANPREVRQDFPLYKEVTFIAQDGEERIRIITQDDGAIQSADLRNISVPANTTFRAETYFADACRLTAGEIGVSHLTGFHLSKDEQLAGAERVRDAVEGKYYDGVIRFTTPVDNSAGERMGYVSIALNHRHLQEIIAHIDPLRAEPVLVTDYESGNYPYLVDDEGWFIAHPKYWDIRGVYADGTPVPAYIEGKSDNLKTAGRTPLNLAQMAWKGSEYPEVLSILRQHGHTTLVKPSLGYNQVEPVNRFRAFAPILYDTKPYDRYGVFGGVALGANSEAIDTLARRVTWEMWVILVVVALVVVVLATLISRDIARPLVTLADAAHDIGRGHLDRRLTVHGHDEVAAVTHAFNRMAEDLRQSRERLRQAERFASIGEVVSGTAHAIKTELNLFGLINNISVLEHLTPENDPRNKSISAIRSGLEGLEHVVHELLDAGPEPEIERLRMEDIVSDVLELFQARCVEQGVEIHCDPMDGEVAIRADRDLVQRILVNVGSNALDAMPEGGHLQVKAVSSGREVRVEVHDTGCGIPEELRQKVFFPFFTTKKEQGGTGFGLYQSHRALRRMGGRMELDSVVGKGTSVILYFLRA